MFYLRLITDSSFDFAYSQGLLNKLYIASYIILFLEL